MPPVYRVLLRFIISAFVFPSPMVKDRSTYDERWTQNVEDKSFWSVFPSDLCSVSHVWTAAAYHRPGVVSRVRCVGIYSECTVALCVLEGAFVWHFGCRVTLSAVQPFVHISTSKVCCVYDSRGVGTSFLLSPPCMCVGKLLSSLVLHCVMNESHQLDAPSLCCSGNMRPIGVVVVKDGNN